MEPRQKNYSHAQIGCAFILLVLGCALALTIVLKQSSKYQKLQHELIERKDQAIERIAKLDEVRLRVEITAVYGSDACLVARTLNLMAECGVVVIEDSVDGEYELVLQVGTIHPGSKTTASPYDLKYSVHRGKRLLHSEVLPDDSRFGNYLGQELCAVMMLESVVDAAENQQSGGK